MSDRNDLFAKSLRKKLTSIETMIQEVKSDLEDAKAHESHVILSKMKSVRQHFDAAKHDVKAAETDVASWLKAKEAAGASVIKGWKDAHESRKLEHHAVTAEGNAIAQTLLAEAAIVGAVIAAYEAIDARSSADEARQTKAA